MIWFVGAGPGAADLITVRGKNLLEHADTVIYAGSLVNPELLNYCREDAEKYNSAYMTLEEVVNVMKEAAAQSKEVVRLHTGDPSIYGAINEQMDALDRINIPYEICPGVSSLQAAAASLKIEYTLPDVSQSVVITRIGGRTPVPEKESLAGFASHGATMVLFLSTGLADKVTEELLQGGCRYDTPAAVVYKATWPEEKVYRCMVGTLKKTVEEAKIGGTALLIIGDVIDTPYRRSELYHPEFATGFRESGGDRSRHRLYVAGIGPGGRGSMTEEARAVIKRCDVVIGYTAYIDLIREEFPGKEYRSTPMRREIERCEMALASAHAGRSTVMICSGDPGIYGMAGPLYELAEKYPDVELAVIPGVTAAGAGAALLGAPLMNDFAVISLSDLLTPLEEIRTRLQKAAEADLVICLYNPSSRKRAGYLAMACDIIGKYRGGDTVCGIAKNIARDGEKIEILHLRELKSTPVDMFSTVFIGNSKTRICNGKMVTPRGYKNGTEQ